VKRLAVIAGGWAGRHGGWASMEKKLHGDGGW